ncbi:MAG: hypothetical protein MR897_04265, partial [Bacteroidales bacterium]|nr:hypothetical protein [Bacteroidales bacterium]
EGTPNSSNQAAKLEITSELRKFTPKSVQWKNAGALKQKHKKQPFSDACASHLSLVLWHV